MSKRSLSRYTLNIYFEVRSLLSSTDTEVNKRDIVFTSKEMAGSPMGEGLTKTAGRGSYKNCRRGPYKRGHTMTTEPLEHDHTEARCTSIIMCSGKCIQEYSAVQGKGISKCQKKKRLSVQKNFGGSS